jgi:hypothetical protein
MFYGTGTMDRQIHQNGTSRWMAFFFFLANTRRAGGFRHSAAAPRSKRHPGHCCVAHQKYIYIILDPRDYL